MTGNLIQRLARGFLLLIALAALSPVRGAQIFNFDYSLPSPLGGFEITATATLTTTDLDAITNTYTIVGISGSRSVDGLNGTIVGLLPGANLLYASEPWVNYDGIYFTVLNYFGITESVNLYYEPGSGYTENWEAAGYGGMSVSPAQGGPAVPEPSTVILLGLGLAVLRVHGCRRKSAAPSGSR